MKRTPLYDAHRAAGARMVDFAGWDMPVQYEGIIAEHTAVRTRAGLFDVSHMGEIEIRGAGAVAACQSVTSNDVARLGDGQAQYSLLLLPSGGIVDDVVVHRFSESRFFICVNASNRDKDAAWIRDNARGAEVVDASDEFALLALQGPRATAILSRLTAAPLASLPRFSFVEGEVAGQRAVIAHTGYTGENGWELYCSPAAARPLWDALLDAGRADELVPAGLGARDTLRLEAALPLYGHELGDDTSPLEARLGWVVRTAKGDFIGREAVQRLERQGLARRLVGIELTEAGVPRAGYEVLRDGKVTGSVTSGTKSPSLGKGIALAYVALADAETGTRLAVRIRDREVGAVVTALPFYRRAGA
jgi:aminomethyltransferase